MSTERAQQNAPGRPAINRTKQPSHLRYYSLLCSAPLRPCHCTLPTFMPSCLQPLLCPEPFLCLVSTQVSEHEGQAAEAAGTNLSQLMDLAGEAAYAVLRERYPNAHRLAVLCGKVTGDQLHTHSVPLR